MSDRPLTNTEQRALAKLIRDDPSYLERMWDEIATDQWRATEAYVNAVRAVETEGERMRRESMAFEERQRKEYEDFHKRMQREMSAANTVGHD